ncbi:MAG: hypothetical protein GY869_23505 [Planctomycetes bacterium]|nr:hypothetical protein [Planctomycetota bacterium]
MTTRTWIGTDSGNEGEWGTAANWSGASVPVDGDDVYLEDSSQSVTADFDQSAVALNSLNIAHTFTGSVGDADDYLNIEASIVNIGYHNGTGNPSGSGRIKIDLDGDDGTTPITVNVYNTKTTGTDSNLPAVRLKINDSSSVINILKGNVGIAMETSETSTVGTINVAYTNNINSDAACYIGSGVTLTTLNTDGGATALRCAATTINCHAGSITTSGSGAVTTVNLDGGSMISNSSGTVTTANITDGTLDLLKSPTARTITTLKLDAPGVLKYDPTTVTLTNKVQPYTTARPITYTAS